MSSAPELDAFGHALAASIGPVLRETASQIEQAGHAMAAAFGQVFGVEVLELAGGDRAAFLAEPALNMLRDRGLVL